MKSGLILEQKAFTRLADTLEKGRKLKFQYLKY